LNYRRFSKTPYLVLFVILGAGGIGTAHADPLTLFSTTFVDSKSVAAEGTSPSGLAFNSDGTKMFVVEPNEVNQYTLGPAFDVSTAAFVTSFSISPQVLGAEGIAFSSGGSKMFIIDNSGNDVNEYTLTTPFDLSDVTLEDSFSVQTQDGLPQDVAFSSDGTKMFVVGSAGDDINEYTLSTAFDLSSTVTFVDSFPVGTEENVPRGVAFNSDGTKMFVVGSGGDEVNQYTLSTGFDVSTASFVESFSVKAQDGQPLGVAFNSDGTKMFVVGNDGNDVNEYTLSTAFDISPISFVDSKSVATEETNPQGVAFNSDGTKMFVVGSSGDAVYEYTLSPAFDVSTASFVVSKSVAGEETSPNGVAFSSDGTKMFVIGFGGNAVNEYSLTTAFDLSSTVAFVDSFSVAGEENASLGVAFSFDQNSTA